jgi:ABC-type multidrug transport system ATPase subunit
MITIRGITKRYRRRLVLDGFDADIPDGGITFLMGPNGAGKTTLIKVLLELERYEGAVMYDGRRLAQVRDEIGIVHDDAPCYRHLTGLQNLRLLANDWNGEDDMSAEKEFALSPTELKRKVRSYSYGQRRKLAIMGAFAGQPRYLIMDEVSNGLDYEAMQELKRALIAAAATTTILLTGHQFDFYSDIVNQVLVLKDGRAAAHPIRPEATGQNSLGMLYEETFGRDTL